MAVPVSHPRRVSLVERHRLTEGLRTGIVAEAGLVAHGRGEALDYLLGERTTLHAAAAEKAAVAALLSAENPVISINGNVAALCPREAVKLAELTGSRLEVNLFYRTLEREEKIRGVLLAAGAKKVY
ncbi:MAG: phosphopantothenate/pantothenate synthetase family protein, partial [Candidatus Altiarchaeota archaeon]